MPVEEVSTIEQKVIVRPSDPNSPIETVVQPIRYHRRPDGFLAVIQPSPPTYAVHLTPSQVQTIFGPMQTGNTVKDAFTVHQVHRVLFQFAQNRSYLKWHRSLQDERRRAIRISKAAKTYLTAVRAAGPDFIDALMDEESDASSRLMEIEGSVLQVIAAADSIASKVGHPGRPSSGPLIAAISQLAHTYSSVTGRSPSRPSPVRKRPGRNDSAADLTEKLDGPFFRWCASVIRVVEPKISDAALDHAIRRAIGSMPAASRGKQRRRK